MEAKDPSSLEETLKKWQTAAPRKPRRPAPNAAATGVWVSKLAKIMHPNAKYRIPQSRVPETYHVTGKLPLQADVAGCTYDHGEGVWTFKKYPSSNPGSRLELLFTAHTMDRMLRDQEQQVEPTDQSRYEVLDLALYELHRQVAMKCAEQGYFLNELRLALQSVFRSIIGPQNGEDAGASAEVFKSSFRGKTSQPRERATFVQREDSKPLTDSRCRFKARTGLGASGKDVNGDVHGRTDAPEQSDGGHDATGCEDATENATADASERKPAANEAEGKQWREQVTDKHLPPETEVKDWVHNSVGREHQLLHLVSDLMLEAEKIATIETPSAEQIASRAMLTHTTSQLPNLPLTSVFESKVLESADYPPQRPPLHSFGLLPAPPPLPKAPCCNHCGRPV
ncbi:hypothetical protein DIPPA_18942 [Diplonema papillatum]|nr:hypothetical protein DIPPA_18942 [Diplonema papillatum]